MLTLITTLFFPWCLLLAAGWHSCGLRNWREPSHKNVRGHWDCENICFTQYVQGNKQDSHNEKHLNEMIMRPNPNDDSWTPLEREPMLLETISFLSSDLQFYYAKLHLCDTDRKLKRKILQITGDFSVEFFFFYRLINGSPNFMCFK